MNPSRRRGAAIAAPVMAVLAALGGIAVVRSAGDDRPATASSVSLDARIASLRVAEPESDAGYQRQLFETWIDADRDGCNTRCEVLERERRSDLAGLPAGGWLSAYDGYSTDDSSKLDIDHVVALREAWVSGADAWDAARRAAFANDLDSPELTAVTASSNRSKGYRDPSSWQPPDQADWCTYAADWVTVKLKWDLSADTAEIIALVNIADAADCM